MIFNCVLLEDIVKPDSPITYGVVKPGDEGDVLLVRSSDVNNNSIDLNKLRTITTEVAQKYKRTKLLGGELLVSLVGNPGKLAIVPDSLVGANIARQVALVRLDEKKVDKRFLYYYLQAGEGKEELDKRIIGSVQLVINLKDLRNVPVKLPSKKQQEHIAHILSTIDEKIEVNNQINKTLENIAQVIFKRWFVDFEFPNEDGEPYQSSGGEMVESELGTIPKGWEVKGLGDITVITMGQSPKGTSYNEIREGVIFYQGRTDFTNRFPKRRIYTTEPSRMAKAGDVLMSVRAPVGDINIANEECCIGRGLCALISKKGYNSFLLYLMLNLKERFSVFNGEGTVFGSINKNDLNGMKVIIGTDLILSKFEEVISNMDRQYHILERETRRIVQIRDALLPKLMSGEIRVPLNLDGIGGKS